MVLGNEWLGDSCPFRETTEDEQQVAEMNFRGFIEYINYSLLDCNELAELFFTIGNSVI